MNMAKKTTTKKRADAARRRSEDIDLIYRIKDGDSEALAILVDSVVHSFAADRNSAPAPISALRQLVLRA